MLTPSIATSVSNPTPMGKKNMSDQPLKGPMAIIMGSEEDGIDDKLLVKCDYLVKIPLIGSIQSLNVSVASAIMIYEVQRQQNIV